MERAVRLSWPRDFRASLLQCQNSTLGSTIRAISAANLQHESLLIGRIMHALNLVPDAIQLTIRGCQSV